MYKIIKDSRRSRFILTMWYVNFSMLKECIDSVKGFILTMWYVNYWVSAVMYLYREGFILTMWYVNYPHILA